jgi:hypothetical protein
MKLEERTNLLQVRHPSAYFALADIGKKKNNTFYYWKTFSARFGYG